MMPASERRSTPGTYRRRASLAAAALALALAPHARAASPEGLWYDRAHAGHGIDVQRETHFGEDLWVTRKGAVSARRGELGIIPGSMGAKSFIVRGLGNAESFHSCSHGAGRVMSRTEARKRITLGEHREATAHVECRKDRGVIDEIPGAYKSIDRVMAFQSDLVDIVHTLRQVVCVKG